MITELEHHSNFVPWQFMAKRTGASFRHIPIDDAGELQLDALDEIAASGNVKVVANNLVSNSLGTINPVEKLAAWAHEQGAIMVVDAAQAAPPRGRRAGARLRLPRRLLAQALRAERDRRALGAGRATRADVAVQSRRRDDPLRRARPDELERAALQVRGRHARDRRGTASAPRSTTSARSGSARSRRTSTSSPPTRWAGSTSSTSCACSGRPSSAGPGSSRSTLPGSTRTTWPRSSTGTASPSGPSTTAPSR